MLILALLTCLGLVAGQDNTSGVDVPDLPAFETQDPARHGYQVVEYADRFDSGWIDEIWQGRMELFDAGGDSVERAILRMLLEGSGGDKSIIRFMSPSEIKGVAALTHERAGTSDDNWLYLPSTKRVRRISGANKTASFQGTEFTYEDLSTLALDDYDWRYVERTSLDKAGEPVEVHVVEARPRYKDTGYSRLLIAYHAEHWRQERVEYFDKAGVHSKTFLLGGWKHIHGRFWRALASEITNHQTGKRTKLVFDKIYLNLALYKSKRTGEARENLTDENFTTRALEGS